VPDVDIGGAPVTPTMRADRRGRNRLPTPRRNAQRGACSQPHSEGRSKARPSGLLPHREQRITADSARDHDPRSARLASPAKSTRPGAPISVANAVVVADRSNGRHSAAQPALRKLSDAVSLPVKLKRRSRASGRTSPRVFKAASSRRPPLCGPNVQTKGCAVYARDAM
jgi:hypothetical protein